MSDALPLVGDARAFPGWRVVEHITLSHPDLKATNTQDHPDQVVPKANGDAALADGQLTATLPPASWNVIRMTQV